MVLLRISEQRFEWLSTNPLPRARGLGFFSEQRVNVSFPQD